MGYEASVESGERQALLDPQQRRPSALRTRETICLPGKVLLGVLFVVLVVVVLWTPVYNFVFPRVNVSQSERWHGQNEIALERTHIEVGSELGVLLVLGQSPEKSVHQVMIDRVKMASAQFKEKENIKKIIVSGGPDHTGKTQAFQMKEALMKEALKLGDIIQEPQASTTAEMVWFGLRWLPERTGRLYIVTSEFHYPRAKYIIDQTLEHFYALLGSDQVPYPRLRVEWHLARSDCPTPDHSADANGTSITDLVKKELELFTERGVLDLNAWPLHLEEDPAAFGFAQKRLRRMAKSLCAPSEGGVGPAWFDEDVPDDATAGPYWQMARMHDFTVKLNPHGNQVNWEILSGPSSGVGGVAKVVLVLGQALNKDGSTPQVLVDRVQTALQLVMVDDFKQVIVSGGDTGGQGQTEASVMKELFDKTAKEKVIPTMTLEPQAMTTAENIWFTARLLKGRILHIVTSDFEIPRAKYIVGATLKYLYDKTGKTAPILDLEWHAAKSSCCASAQPAVGSTSLAQRAADELRYLDSLEVNRKLDGKYDKEYPDMDNKLYAWPLGISNVQDDSDELHEALDAAARNVVNFQYCNGPPEPSEDCKEIEVTADNEVTLGNLEDKVTNAQLKEYMAKHNAKQ